jgi:hypothetical protein
VAGNKKFTVSAEIRAEDRASPVVGRITRSFQSLGSELKERFVITAGDVVNAAGSIVRAVGSMFAAAAEAERGQTRLTQALERQGAATPRVVSALNEQAQAIARVTDLQDDQITSVQTLLAQLGVQASQIPEATQATIDLAAALGIDLNTAAQQVGATVNGVTGRLARVAPELANLSDEALRSGEGIRLLGERFKGAGEAASEDFGKQLAGLKNDLGELGEAFATGATGTGDFEEAVRSAREEVQQFGPTAEILGQTMGNVVSILVSALEGLISVSKKAGDFFASALLPEVANAVTVTEQFRDAANASVEAMHAQGEAAAEAAAAHGDLAATADAAGNAIAGASDSTNNLTASQREAAASSTALDTALKAVGITVEDRAAKEAALLAILEQAELANVRRQISDERYVAIVAAVNAELEKLRLTQEGVVESTDAATDAFSLQADSLSRVATAAGSAAVAIGQLEERQRSLDGLRGQAVGISLAEVEALERFPLGRPSGLGLGGHSSGLGFGGRRGVTVDPNGRRVRAA